MGKNEQSGIMIKSKIFIYGACGDGSKTIQGGYVRILEFRHFASFFRFDRKEQNSLKSSFHMG